MSETKSYDWQVPEYRVIFEGERKCGSCLIIPVINEGERILSLLSRIQKTDAASSSLTGARLTAPWSRSA